MWLDEWLFKKGIKQAQLAKMIGYDRSYLSQVISGKKKAGPELAKIIWDLTNHEVKLTEILYGDRTQYSKPPEERTGIL